MKKAFLYAFAAVVLGVGIMLFPLWTFFRSYNEEGPITGSPPYLKPMTASENWPEYTRTKTEDTTAFNGVPEAQIQPTDASLQILTVGFIAAMIVYFIVKRRLRRPTYLSTYRFPPC